MPAIYQGDVETQNATGALCILCFYYNILSRILIACTAQVADRKTVRNSTLSFHH